MALSVTPARAVLLDYWSFNSESLNPTLGVATLTASHSGAGIMQTKWVTGTVTNTQLDQPAGKAVEFSDTAFFPSHRLTLSGLDFSDVTNVTLSFAVKSSAIFDVHEKAYVTYSTDGSHWSDPIEFALPASNWEYREISFGSLLDNVPNAWIRIEHEAIFEIGETLAFDNLTVVAVPEPGSMALLGGAIVALAGWRRFSRKPGSIVR